tara:strand:- start:5844 stop:6755 length:912 start_codon:yes stop_codon:yes gene_type:complete
VFLSHEELLRSDIADRVSPDWKAKIETGAVQRTASGLPILIDNSASLVDIDQLTNARGRGVDQSREGIRLRISEACSRSYDVAERNAAQIVQTLGADRPIVGLVVGGGTLGPGVQRLMNEASVHLVSFDVYDAERLTFVGDGHWIPFVDGSIDFVWIQAVLEHVADPGLVASECERVLKAGGLVYAETPFMQQVHAGVYDFTRFTGLGHRMLFPKCDTVSSGAIDGPGVALIWSLRYFFAGLFRSKNVGRVIGLLFGWLKLFDYIIPENRRQMGAASFYFLGKKRQASKPLLPREMIGEYGGV